MKRTVIWMFVILLSAAIGVVAETAWKVDGQVRLREQTDDKSFAPDSSEFTYFEMRTRLGVEATIEENTHVYIQLQDSRLAGDINQFGERQSGTLSDSKNVDLHQAYVKIDNIFGEGWGGKGGRFEFNRGNQRVFGAVGWHNVGRSFEGSMLWYDRDDLKIEAFAMRLRELQAADDEGDFWISGLYSNIRPWNLDLFAFLEKDDQQTGFPEYENDLERLNLGLYYQRTSGAFDVELNGVYQVGERTHPTDSVAAALDISAFLITFEGGYTLDGSGNVRLAGGIDYSSGDDDPGDLDYNTYENTYYTGHKFRGHMDYFLASDPAGLVDILVRGRIDPINGWTINGDIHYFMTAKDYVSDLDGSESSDVGLEIDLSVSTVRVRGVKLEGGISVFLPEDHYAGISDPDPGVWAYSIATANF